MTDKRPYRTPYPFSVPRTDSPYLYKLEERLHKAVRDAATAWGEVASRRLGIPTNDFFKETLPQALFDLLDHYDRESARLAAEAYLKHRHEAEVQYPKK